MPAVLESKKYISSWLSVKVRHYGGKRMLHLLETRALTKKFGNFTANDKVDFWCDSGSVVSLLGENGAGKSTLMKTIYGMHAPDGGEILFEGKPVNFRSPRDAIARGIQMVHQHFMLIDELTVAENIVMGKEPKKHGLYNKKEAEKLIKEISDSYGFLINPTDRVGDLSVGEKQRVEIIKVLYQGARLLILDEPTAVLTPQETEGLFDVIRRLRKDGKAVIIITHKLQETMEIADDIFVLRQGMISGHIRKEETTPYQLTRMMVDHELAEFKRPSPKLGEEVLSVEGLSYTDKSGTNVLNDLNLHVRSGEIYGIAGIEGNGQTEFMESLSGIIKSWTGSVKMFGREIKGKAANEILEMGVSFVHSDRMERGLLLELDVPMNIFLGNQSCGLAVNKQGIIDYKKLGKMSEEIFAHYQVTPADKELPLRSFSGGNQQKIIIGREFYRNPGLAVIAHPTRGVDIGVCEIIRQSIVDLKEAGAAIVLITADFDELFQLSDRIGVMYEGHIVTEGFSEEYTPMRLGLYMGGGTEDEDKEVS